MLSLRNPRYLGRWKVDFETPDSEDVQAATESLDTVSSRMGYEPADEPASETIARRQ